MRRMRPPTFLLPIALLGACSQTSDDSSAAVMRGAGRPPVVEVRDDTAHLAAGEDAAVPDVIDAGVPDAAPAADAAVIDVTCEPFTRRYRMDAPGNGPHWDATNFHAFVTGVGPDDRFTVALCDYAPIEFPTPDANRPDNDPPPRGDCPEGYTCTGSTMPSGRRCIVNASGTFYDGRLVVTCGSETVYYDSAGQNVVRRAGGRYQAVTVTKF